MLLRGLGGNTTLFPKPIMRTLFGASPLGRTKKLSFDNVLLDPIVLCVVFCGSVFWIGGETMNVSTR
jgi:hypothetical protein